MESKQKSEGRRDPCFDCLYSSRSFFSSFGDKYLNCERIGILNGLHPTTCSGQLHFILKKNADQGKKSDDGCPIGKCVPRSLDEQSENPLEISLTSCNPPPNEFSWHRKAIGNGGKTQCYIGPKWLSLDFSFRLGTHPRIEWNLSEK